MLKKTFVLLVCLTTLFSACKKKDADLVASLETEELAQQVGELMASVDETGGSSGNITSILKRDANLFARLAPGSLGKPSAVASLTVPSASATACSASTWGACATGGAAANTVRHNFGGCTIGGATFTGYVDLRYTGSAAGTCALGTVPSSIMRDPNYTVTGLRGATLAVTKTSTWGQTLSYVWAGPPKQFSYGNDGIRRVFTLSGATLYDTTTTIENDGNGQPMGVVGAPRNGRILREGRLVITDNLSSKVCKITPTAVTWNGSCNCAISGSFAGTCTDGTTTTDTSLTITGCGTAQATFGTTTTAVTFDRCY